MKTLSSIQKNREEEFDKDWGRFYVDNDTVDVLEFGKKKCIASDSIKRFNKQTTLALLESMVSMVKERQRGWYGSEEDGSDRHPNFDEDQYFLDYLQEQITEIKK